MERIGYLVPEFPSQTHAFFWREISSLRALGVSVEPVSTKRPAPGACRHPFAAEAASQTHYSFPPRWLHALWALVMRPRQVVDCLAYIAGLKETPWRARLRMLGLLLVAADVLSHSLQKKLQHLHVHSCADTAHIAALCYLLGGPRYSLTLHGDLPVYGVDHPAKMRHAVFVSCVTTPLQRQVMEQVGLPLEQAPVLWMGVDTRRFVDSGERQTTAGTLRLVTVARLNFLKGHHHALAAMRRLVDAGLDLHYTIVGEGPHRQEIADEIRRLALQDRVQLTGTMGEDEVLKVLQAADVLVLPSFGQGEAAPVAVMEAMSCSLPVVCSIIGGTADMIDDGKDGFLVPQRDEDALTDRLQRLAQDVDLRQRMGQAARQKALAQFEVQALAKRLYRLMDDAYDDLGSLPIVDQPLPDPEGRRRSTDQAA